MDFPKNETPARRKKVRGFFLTCGKESRPNTKELKKRKKREVNRGFQTEENML